MLSLPISLWESGLESAHAPVAVFRLPRRLFLSALEPTAVLKVPLVFSERALKPRAVLSAPVVWFRRALFPSAVLRSIYPPSGAGGGRTASAPGESIKQRSVNVMKSGRIAVLSCVSGFICFCSDFHC